MQRVQPQSPTCERGHPRTETNTRWFRHTNGKEYAQCRACQRESRPSKAHPPAELARRKAARAQAHLAEVLTRYVVDPETGCWLWTGRLDSWGYGNAYGRMVHRVFYEQLVGPIPEGLELDHLCCNRPCVNPAHLEPVTPAQNSRRGERCHLTVEQIREIRHLYAEGCYNNELSRQFGVSTTHIRRIVTGRAWREPL